MMNLQIQTKSSFNDRDKDKILNLFNIDKEIFFDITDSRKTSRAVQR